MRNAPVVTGVRLPDDESDLVVHRGGRFINNKYVPDGLEVPREMVVRAELGPGGPQLRTGRSYQASDYTFSPLQHYEQQQQLQQGLPTVLEADQDDFVIQEQTYKMCPTCPTFSVPVPIPKTNDFYQEKSEEKSIFSRIAEMVSPAIETAREFFNRRPENNQPSTDWDRQDTGLDNFQQGQREENKLTTPLLTGLAAVGFGLTSFLTSRLSGNSHRFELIIDMLMLIIMLMSIIDVDVNHKYLCVLCRSNWSTV